MRTSSAAKSKCHVKHIKYRLDHQWSIQTKQLLSYNTAQQNIVPNANYGHMDPHINTHLNCVMILKIITNFCIIISFFPYGLSCKLSLWHLAKTQTTRNNTNAKGCCYLPSVDTATKPKAKAWQAVGTATQRHKKHISYLERKICE